MYLFECERCHGSFELEFRMGDGDGRSRAKCPECRSRLRRVFTSPAAIVKSTIGSTFSMSDAKTFIDHDGQPIRLKFMDHGDRGEVAQGSIMKKHKGARWDEKTGQYVVDVMSNVPDPLGRLERAKTAGNADIKKIRVGQKVKTRKVKK